MALVINHNISKFLKRILNKCKRSRMNEMYRNLSLFFVTWKKAYLINMNYIKCKEYSYLSEFSSFAAPKSGVFLITITLEIHNETIDSTPMANADFNNSSDTRGIHIFIIPTITTVRPHLCNRSIGS
jgi:hypothetical protein